MDEIQQKELEYIRYLIRHIAYVQEAYSRLIVPLRGKGIVADKSIEEAGDLVKVHDRTKFDAVEFYPYRKKFFPTSEEKSHPNWEELVKLEFHDAWEHHHEHNLHHPIQWTMDGEKKSMEEPYVLEMICDWDAMSHQFGTNLCEWYDNKAIEEKSHFTEETLELVDRLIDYLFRIPGIDW